MLNYIDLLKLKAVLADQTEDLLELKGPTEDLLKLPTEDLLKLDMKIAEAVHEDLLKLDMKTC